MKARELADLLIKNPDFNVEFSFSEADDSAYGMSVRKFANLQIEDIGYSDGVILLGGEEL